MKIPINLFTCQHCQKTALAPDGHNPPGNWVRKKIGKKFYWFCCAEHHEDFLKINREDKCPQCGGNGWIYDGPDRTSGCPTCVANRNKIKKGEK